MKEPMLFEDLIIKALTVILRRLDGDDVKETLRQIKEYQEWYAQLEVPPK
jgi:hypothetical protein